MISIPQYLLIVGISFDTLITAIGVLKFHGKEANRIINWINPPELMIFVLILDSLIYIPFVLWLHSRVNDSKKYGIIPDVMITSVGLMRLISGISWVLV